MRGFVRGCAAGLAAMGLAFPALAADEGLVLRQSAERLAAADRCEEAIVKAKRARTLDPEDAEAAALEGRCLLHLKRYDAAIDPLKRARSLDPSIDGLSIDLAMAHYHRGDLAAAERDLRLAAERDPGDARVQLYQGLVLLERSRDEEAAAAFERAATRDPNIDPLASYYSALAWQRARERQKARAALEGVVQRSPDSQWGRRAQALLDELDEHVGFTPGGVVAQASVGVEYDDNVVLEGDDPTVPSNVSDEGDGRVWWSAELGAELFRTENWAGGANAGFYGDLMFELQRFNTYTPMASLWLDRRIDEVSFVRLQPFFGYTWNRGDPYLANSGATLSYDRSFDDWGAGTLYGTFAYRNYMFNTTNPRVIAGGVDWSEERDRDGTDFRVGYDHAVGVTDSTTLRAGVEHQRYEAEGRDYSHVGYGGHVGVYQQLPWRVGLDVDFAYAYEPYRQPSSYPAPFVNHKKRRDNRYTVRAQLDRPITDWLSVTAYYRHENNESNTAVFDYDRNVYGGLLTVYYGPQ
ncbi:MAG: surface lipoprotein assembly modifier [Myxococcota bacterium]